MTKFPFLTGALALAVVFSIPQWMMPPVAFADSPDCGCPVADPSATPEKDPTPKGSNDPGFVMATKEADVAAIQREAALKADRITPKKPSDLVAVDQAHYQAYLESVKKDPAGAFSEAVLVWKGNDSVDLQRLVLIKALGSVRSTDESDALQFMLKALDAPEVQRSECARLGRGNSLEKSIAAKRIALLESNPRLQEASEAK